MSSVKSIAGTLALAAATLMVGAAAATAATAPHIEKTVDKGATVTMGGACGPGSHVRGEVDGGVFRPYLSVSGRDILHPTQRQFGTGRVGNVYTGFSADVTNTNRSHTNVAAITWTCDGN